MEELYKKKILMKLITMMVWSVTQSQTFWSVKSSGPLEALFLIKLLPLSHFNRVRLCVTPLLAGHQAPLSLGFSRQEHWTGLPFPSPMHESEK